MPCGAISPRPFASMAPESSWQRLGSPPPRHLDALPSIEGVEPKIVEKVADALRPFLKDPNQAPQAITQVVAIAA